MYELEGKRQYRKVVVYLWYSLLSTPPIIIGLN
jgi:hypothetical protein